MTFALFKSLSQMIDDCLWPVFSQYIRLKEADENGHCQCFTCGETKFWDDGDCGHGIPRGNMATKYDERNNHFQCYKCNRLKGGREAMYEKRVNDIYGPGTWDELKALARTVAKLTAGEIKEMTRNFRARVKKLKAEKDLN